MGGGGTYIVEGGALHGFVLLQGVHLVQVAVSDEHSSVLRLVETVDLIKTKLLISHPAGGGLCARTRTHTRSLNTPQGAGANQDSCGFIYVR